MPDKHKKFHEFAVKSILFKGRSDWYFCFLKAEKLAHVLYLLAENTAGERAEALVQLAVTAGALPQTIVHFAAGEVESPLLLADIFSLLSAVRLGSTSGLLSKENGALLVEEYEQVAEKLGAGAHPSPFLSEADFSLPELVEPQRQSLLSQPAPLSIKDTKGHSKGHVEQTSPVHEERASRILEFVRKNKGVSIRDIAAVVKNCSEKTIQRELVFLIKTGLIHKEGQRRWSIYRAP